MRHLLLLVAAAIPVLAQADWNGTWRGEKIELTLQTKADGSVSGVILFEGQKMPVTARAAGAKLEGTFTAEGKENPLTLSRAEAGSLKLSTDGFDFVLAPVAPPRTAARNPLAAAKAAANQGTIVGEWQGPQGVVKFNPDGTVIIGGQGYRYAVQGSTLLLIANDGQAPVPFTLAGDSLTLGMGGQTVKMTRLAAGQSPVQPAGGGVRQELVGKWCYQANVYATNGGARSSTQCFVLHANGTYEYSGESDSYNPNGGATSQSYDAGTWTATDTTITANSRFKGTTTYRLEKRNHPKNVNDPMLVLDGQAFVTAFQKAPWR